MKDAGARHDSWQYQTWPPQLLPLWQERECMDVFEADLSDHTRENDSLSLAKTDSRED